MSRPKGSKNKEKSTEDLLRILQKRNIPIPENLLPESGVIPAVKKTKKPEKPITEVAQPAAGVTRENFELTQNKPASKTVETVYRCGNTLCNKVLPEALPVCPHCGARLSWA